MRKGTINGATTLAQDTVEIRVSEVIARSGGLPEALVVECVAGGDLRWRSTVTGLRGDPRRNRSSASVEDFAGLIWPESGRVALAGESAVKWIDLATGALVFSQELRFVGKASLDFLVLSLAPDRSACLVASTKSVFVFDRALNVRMSYEAMGAVTSAAFEGTRAITISELDVLQVDLPSVSKVLSF